MFIRIFVKGIALAIFILLAIGHTGAGRFILAIASIVAVASISHTLNNYKKLKLETNILVIDQFFSGKEKFNLNEVRNWKEHRYYLRGHLQRSLILFFDRDTKIIISLYDDKDEFDKVFQYLKQNLQILELSRQNS
jgi:hypothetical protein